MWWFFFSLQMYLVIFPEGTRYNPELKNVIADSQAFATKEGTKMMADIFCCHAAHFIEDTAVCKTSDKNDVVRIDLILYFRVWFAVNR